MKFLFMPISILGGIIAGLVGKKIFEQIWGLIDKEEPPDAKHREIDYRKLVIALLLEGRDLPRRARLFDHGARQGLARLTGAWPGEEAPEPE